MLRFIATILVAAALAAAQAPSVAEINFYGVRRVAPARILEILKLKAGDPLPPSKGQMEDTISDISGVVLARVEAVCCEGPSAVLFIGVEERGAAHPVFRRPPEGNAALPENIMDLYGRLPSSVEELTGYTASHLPEVRKVLRDASAAEQRAVAAALIGYAPNPAVVLDDLQLGLQDPDESVRANAARSLGAIMEQQPSLAPKIAPTWLVELLNSIALSDRVEASKALLTLTEQPHPSAISQLRERALDSLADMARWKTPRYALSAYLLLGRVAGATEAEVHQKWEQGDRESVIRKALATPAGRKPRGLQ